mgnify:CR=1 FL=1
MILQSLYNYYQILLDDPDVEIAEPGYSAAKISFALNLSPDGELLDILPFTSKYFDGKKERERTYRFMVVPEQVKKTGINPLPNFLWDSVPFMLGISENDADDPMWSRKRFETFKKHNSDLLSKANSDSVRAIVAFLNRHDPQNARQHPVIARHLDALLKGGFLIFWVNGKDITKDPEIRRVWDEYKSGEEAAKMQCLVTGKIEPIARLHPSIQGVRDANSTGASLVGFNERAYESYNRVKGQGLNSPVSQRVASGYGVALNYLLSDQNPNRKIYLGDTTVAYWADTADKRYPSAFYAFLNPEYQQAQEEQEEAEGQEKRRRAKEKEKQMSEMAESVQQGKAIDLAALRKDLDDSIRFYVLGLASNVSRLAVRFFLTEPFGVFAERIMQHYKDLEIEKEYPNQPTYISPYRILAECVSPKVTQRDDEVKKSWSLLGGAFMRSILTGAPYPEGLYAAMLNRIRHDTDETSEKGKTRSVKINYIRAAYIKAHLIRKFRRGGNNPYQEALQMSLNPSYNHPAYVLGRLFAVLERAQKAALGKNVNATIKDRYFTSACATPASVFPTLLRLSQHHLNKAEYGGYLERQIQDLLGMLEAKPFPTRLTLEEQGVFVLGYYHQRGFRKDDEVEETAQPAE